MLTTKTFKNGLLAATMFGAFAVAASGAQAETIFFNPGAADPGGAPHTNFLSAAFEFADLNANVAVEQFNWASVNRTVVNGSPTFGTDHQQWRIEDQTNFDGSLDTGDSFGEFFDFHLVNVDNATPNDDAYGSTGTSLGIPFRTHVFMTADLSGTVVSGFNSAGNGIDDLVLDYDVADFEMFFDVDGDKATTGDQFLLASFGSEVRQGSANGDLGILDLLWDVSWDRALEGVFFLDEAGTQDVTANDTDGADGDGLKDVLAGNGSGPVFFKLTQQAVTEGVDDPAGTGLIVESQGGATGTSEINVPEPGTLALFGLGLLGLGVASHRRRKALKA